MSKFDGEIRDILLRVVDEYREQGIDHKIILKGMEVVIREELETNEFVE